jgi:hypothetical protein
MKKIKTTVLGATLTLTQLFHPSLMYAAEQPESEPATDAEVVVEEQVQELDETQAAKAVMEEAEEEVAAVQKRYDEKNTEYKQQQTVTDQAYQTAYQAAYEPVEQAKKEFDAAAEKLEEAQKNQEALDAKVQEAVLAEEEAEKQLAEAQAVYDEAAKKAEEMDEEEVAKASDALKEAQSAYDEENGKLASCQEALDAAQSAYEAALQAKENAQENNDKAVQEAAQAQEDLESASSQLSQLKTVAENAGITEETVEGYTSAVSAFNTAQADLEQKQASQAQAQEALSQAQSNADEMEAALAQAQSNLDKALAQQTAASNTYSEIESELAAAKEAQTDTAAAIEAAQAAFEQAKIDLDKAKADVYLTHLELETAQEAYDQGEDNYDVLVAEYNEALAQYNLGSLGYFEYIADTTTDPDEKADAQKAIEILKDTDGSTQYNTTNIVGPSTNLGAKHDATNLESMNVALQDIDEVNVLRAENHLNTLTITHELMAIAQKQLNWSASADDHSYAYNVGENLAWGYPDPYDGWYTQEKVLYDDLVAQGYTVEDMEADETMHEMVGHYLNIINPNYRTTGYAHMAGSNVYDHVADGQTFDTVSGGVSVVDYLDSFTTYYESVMEELESTKEALDDYDPDGPWDPSEAHIAALNEAKAKYNNALTAYDNVLITYNEAKTAAEEAENGTPGAEKINTLTKELETAKTAKNKADADVKTAQDALESTTAKASSANTALESAKAGK